ncbi:hypothetical protein [Roseitranquillus sediminis]|uniref:hypothetical protein n=1 Tax=Roseitranquillus sediminis TaxID=2809051 RepID=UPI001D0CA979|nr:hypothetical protein [Roseitranquillus sediminis]MBM9594402.1 hypothetical protein [Roseitranquillus sediminis]
MTMLLPALMLATTAATAEADSGVAIELNALEQAGGACRLTFTVGSRMEQDLEQLVLETVVFDRAGKVAALTLFDFLEVPAGRTRVRQFDLPEMSCGELAGFLVNGAATCTVAGAASEICDDAVVTSRTKIEALR